MKVEFKFGENFQDTTVLERIWQEGVSSVSYFVTVYSERQTFVQTSFTEGSFTEGTIVIYGDYVVLRS